MTRTPQWLFSALMFLLVGGCARTVSPLPPVPNSVPTPLPIIQFPRDADPHAALTEWWYFTGHLQSQRDGHHYGFEFTVFQAQRQDAPTGYLAHFAITDIDAQRFSHQSRVTQTTQPVTQFPIDIGGWTLTTTGISAQMDSDAGYTLQLELTDTKQPALHHGGSIDYGAAGQSYYYSRTRLRVSGTLQSEPVSGQAWMDHQWGDFIVSSGVVWDWYSLQFDDQTELMLYVLRDANGHPISVYGTDIHADGRVRDVDASRVQVEAISSWTSPHTRGTYPSGWRLVLADGARIDVRPQVRDQELYFPGASFASPAYWEGAVSVSGDRAGVGYVELTGYAGR